MTLTFRGDYDPWCLKQYQKRVPPPPIWVILEVDLHVCIVCAEVTCIYFKKERSWNFIMADGGHFGFGLNRNSWPPGRRWFFGDFSCLVCRCRWLWYVWPRWFFMSRHPLTKWKWETPLTPFCKRVYRRGTGLIELLLTMARSGRQLVNRSHIDSIIR